MCGALEASWPRCAAACWPRPATCAARRSLAESIYGVGPVTALALTCWLGGAGRFSSARKAVRFCGLESPSIPPTASARPGTCPGRDRRCCAGALYKAGKTHARPRPRPRLLRRGKDRKDGKRAAFAEARKIVRRACHILSELGDDALAMV